MEQINVSFNRTSFQQQLKRFVSRYPLTKAASIVHPFNNNWNRYSGRCKRASGLQSYILSTTTETNEVEGLQKRPPSFNRTSFQQQLKRSDPLCWPRTAYASIVHPFNNNWNYVLLKRSGWLRGFNRTSFQQQLKLTFSPTSRLK